ncbi:MAG: hypothetical protein JO165_11440 [Candidatus Eremiobacteraeota bacterium]|nr:hypothetical protein [Candidatus Eremiobacteraeota bacterium]
MRFDALHTTAALLGVITLQWANASAVNASAASAPSGRALSGAAAPARIADASTNALELEARQLPGSEAVLVSGVAAPSAPLSLTLFATISPDIPTVVVGHCDLRSQSDGTFKTVMSIAPAYQRGAIFLVLATGANGARGQVQPSPRAPNAGISVPFDSH